MLISIFGVGASIGYVFRYLVLVLLSHMDITKGVGVSVGYANRVLVLVLVSDMYFDIGCLG